jgi:hypothetical protein
VRLRRTAPACRPRRRARPPLPAPSARRRASGARRAPQAHGSGLPASPSRSNPTPGTIRSKLFASDQGLYLRSPHPGTLRAHACWNC